MKTKPNKEHLDLMSKDPMSWKGVFYYNRKDPRVLVPKQNPMLGMTFNFGNIYAMLSLICILLALIGLSYLLN